MNCAVPRMALLAAMCRACEIGDLTEVIKLGADTAVACDNNGVQPVHIASAAGHIEAVQWLVSQGAAVGARANNGMRAIHSASAAGHIKVVQFHMQPHAGHIKVVQYHTLPVSCPRDSAVPLVSDANLTMMI